MHTNFLCFNLKYYYLGLSWFLKYSNCEFFEKELLPQLWHLLTDKYIEKRLLVAEACSWFSPLIGVSLNRLCMQLLLYKCISVFIFNL